MPGMVPGQMAFGHASALAGAPSMTGGILIIDSSSLGNLKPASLKALPKSLSFGKSRWHVAQLVPYKRENAGIALAEIDHERKTTRRKETLINLQRNILVITAILLSPGVTHPAVATRCGLGKRWLAVSLLASRTYSDPCHNR